jgi:prophage regulatory protein
VNTVQTGVRNARMRIPAVCEATGERSRSNLYAKMAAGLMPRPIKTGPRAAALPAYEVEAINAARIRGDSDDQIRALVTKLHEQRKAGTLPQE